MSLMDIYRKATVLEEKILRHKDVRAEHLAELAHLVAELASASSSATDPRLWDQS
jgi:hypothetical protein